MLTLEEALICCIELKRVGFKYVAYYGDRLNGYHVRASRTGPRDAGWYAESWVKIEEPSDLAPWIRDAGATDS